MKKIEEAKQFISIAELAKKLGISRIAVFNKVKKGEIPAEKVGRAYVIASTDAELLINGSLPKYLTEESKSEIRKGVEKVVKEYGETLKLLGKE